MTPSCPTADDLNSLLTGSLDDAVRLPLEEHIESCQACQTWLDGHAGQPPDSVPVAPPAVPPEALNRWLALPQTPGLSSGDRLGPYRVDVLLGRGGMGVVYRGTDLTLNRSVAVKVLSATLDPDAAARLVREAQAVARVRHDHVVQVFAAAADPGQPAYLAMELVDGPTLRKMAADARGLDPRLAANLVAQVADGLSAAHAAGLVHRDVKPGNVLVDAAMGRAKLADFGLARTVDAVHVTRSGVVLGTPAYMAPEQVRDPSAAGPAADVYGLGATLYEALTGAEPFRGSVELVLRQVLADDPLPPRQLNPAVPRDLDTITLKCLEKDPARRYPSAAALRDDLRRWLAGEPVLARPVGRFGRAVRWSRRNPVVAGLLTALVVGSVAGFAVVTVLWLRADQAAKVAEAARQAADDDYRRAEAVVNHFYQKMYDGGSVAAPVDLKTRLELIRDAVGFYEEAARRRPGEKPPAELAAVYARLGMLHQLLGEDEPADAAFQTALNLFDEADRAGTMNPKRRRERGECWFNLGVSAGWRGDAAAAAKHYAAAVEQLEPLAAADPQAKYYLAGALGSLAQADEILGEAARAGAARERALAYQRELRTADPKNAGAFMDLCLTAVAVATAQRDPATAATRMSEADQLAQEFGKTYAGDFSAARVLAQTKAELAIALLRVGRQPEAAEAARQAIVYVTGGLTRYPKQFQHPAIQARAWTARAEVQWAAGDHKAAEADWQKAAAILEPLPRRSLTDALTHARLAGVYDRLVAAAEHRRDTAEAARRRKQAADTRDALRQQFPGFKPGG